MQKLIIVLLSLLLSSCALFKTKVVIKEVPVKVKIVCNMKTVEPVTLEKVEWQLGRNDKGDNVLALDGKNYSNLAINIGRVTDHIYARRQYSEYLELCITRFNNTP